MAFASPNNLSTSKQEERENSQGPNSCTCPFYREVENSPGHQYVLPISHLSELGYLASNKGSLEIRNVMKIFGRDPAVGTLPP